MKIGVFGSSFNPIHIGHLIICEQARIRLGLDKILFVPTQNPYHKKVELLDYDTRYNMTAETIKDNPYFEMSDVERNFETSSYSFDVMNILNEKYDAQFYFIMGSDSFNDLKSWYRYVDFVNLTSIVVFKRPGYDLDMENLDEINTLSQKLIVYYDDLQIEISSTKIREDVQNGIIPRYLLHDNTIDFIEGKKLW